MSSLSTWLLEEPQLDLQLGFLNSLAVVTNLRFDVSVLNQLFDFPSRLFLRDLTVERITVRFSTWNAPAFTIEVHGIRLVLSFEKAEEERCRAWRLRTSKYDYSDYLRKNLLVLDSEGCSLHHILERILFDVPERKDFTESILNLILKNCHLEAHRIHVEVRFPILNDEFMCFGEIKEFSARSKYLDKKCLLRGFLSTIFIPTKEISCIFDGIGFRIGFIEKNNTDRVLLSSDVQSFVKLRDLKLADCSLCFPELAFSLSPHDISVCLVFDKLLSDKYNQTRSGRELWRIAASRIGHVTVTPRLSLQRLVGVIGQWIHYVNAYEKILLLTGYSTGHIWKKSISKIYEKKLILGSARYHWEVISDIEKKLPAEGIALARRTARHRAAMKIPSDCDEEGVSPITVSCGQMNVEPAPWIVSAEASTMNMPSAAKGIRNNGTNDMESILWVEPANFFLLTETKAAQAEDSCDSHIGTIMRKLSVTWKGICSNFNESEIEYSENPCLLCKIEKYSTYPDRKNPEFGFCECGLMLGKLNLVLNHSSVSSVSLLLSQVQHAICLEDRRETSIASNFVDKTENAWVNKYEFYSKGLIMALLQKLPEKHIHFGVFVDGPCVRFSHRSGASLDDQGIIDTASQDNFDLTFDFHVFEGALGSPSFFGMAPLACQPGVEDTKAECFTLEPHVMEIPKPNNDKYASSGKISVGSYFHLNGINACLEQSAEEHQFQLFVLEPITVQTLSFRYVDCCCYTLKDISKPCWIQFIDKNTLRVRVIDNQVILKNLPPNHSLINEIMDRVKEFLASKALLKGDPSTASSPLRGLRGESEWQIGPTVLTLCEHLFVSFAIRMLRRQANNFIFSIKWKRQSDSEVGNQADASAANSSQNVPKEKFIRR